MNPLTQIRNQRLLNEKELQLGYANTSSSWHALFKDSAWIYIGGLDYELTEGDLVCVFSQYGEVVNVNLVRDQATGRSKGFAFLCYEDQRSTVLASDNLNGAQVCGRTLRVNHVDNYKVKELKLGKGKAGEAAAAAAEEDLVRKHLRERGCAPGAGAEAVSASAAASTAAEARGADKLVKQERIDPGYPDHPQPERRERRRSRSRSRSQDRSRRRQRSPAERQDRRQHYDQHPDRRAPDR